MKKLIVLFSTAVMFFSSCQFMETPYFPPLNGLVLNTENATMIFEITESMQLSATIVPLRSTDKLILEWESSDPLVVQIDQNGVMIPLSIGESIITVRAISGDKTLTATCEVEVISQWESLGIGQFYDAFLDLGLVDVEVQQSIVNRNKYRVIDPYPVALVSQDSWYGGPRSEEIEFWVTSEGTVAWDEFWYIGLNYSATEGQPIKAYLPSALAASQAPNDANSKFLTDNTVYFSPYYYVDSLGGYGLQDVYLSLPGAPDLFIEDDRDGKVYKTVTIGEQVWMAENLAYLPSVVGPATESFTEPHYYVYGYDGTNVTAAKGTTNYNKYGVLYNWPAALTACPEGWHLPSDAEWTTLTTYLGGESVAGGKMKEAGESHWTSPNTGATNESGFTALPGGYRDGSGKFYSIGLYGGWWSSTEGGTNYAWSRTLYYSIGNVYRGTNSKELGFSVRCVRD
jgi:uncharacterized protein (TIGR02145 family)